MIELPEDALIVFVSDCVGLSYWGDPGCDGFESPGELAELFGELARYEGPVELVLAGDFFDFLQIGRVPEGMDRAALTMDRAEYEGLFAALARFRGTKGKRVVYLPGNHDAESFWNPQVRETLQERGVVDEFARSYLASMEVGGSRRLVYCEHGNQWDPANTVRDYGDPLDTPLGHHVVTDFTRRVAPLGVVSGGLDLSEIKNVYPLVEIPRWVASRYLYDAAGLLVAYLLLPLLVLYAVYRVASYLFTLVAGVPVPLLGDRGLPRVHELLLDVAIFGLITLVVFALFFIVVRRTVRGALATARPGPRARYTPAEDSKGEVRGMLADGISPPMAPGLDLAGVDVFVWGHTHLPSLEEVERGDGSRAVMVNSGC